VAAGAQLAGTLRPGQARIAVLAALLAAEDPTAAAAALRRILGTAPQALPASELYLVERVGK
jgi:L-asparaginase